MQQSHRWRAAGKVLEIRKHGPAIYILTETLRGVITPYSDEIIRVQFSDYDSFNDHNYAVIEEPTALEYKFETINIKFNHNFDIPFVYFIFIRHQI
jgi:hypothetical protein